jgi:hypothetical protein
VIDIRVAGSARLFRNKSFELGDDMWRPSSSPKGPLTNVVREN